MLHGYDDQGSQFDAKGNFDNWWTADDRKKFEERTAKLVNQFDNYVAIDGLHVKGELTLGENIADLGGLTVAYDAFHKATENMRLRPIDQLLDHCPSAARPLSRARWNTVSCALS